MRGVTINDGRVRKDNKRREKRFKLKKEAEAWEVKMRAQSSEEVTPEAKVSLSDIDSTEEIRFQKLLELMQRLGRQKQRSTYQKPIYV